MVNKNPKVPKVHALPMLTADLIAAHQAVHPHPILLTADPIAAHQGHQEGNEK